MQKKAAYLTQYFNLTLEWERININIDTASENQIAQLQELQTKALEQSGLSLTELTLIRLCRKYRTFRKVNTYAKRQIGKL